MKSPIILVDVMNLAFRAHFSHSSLTTEDGEPTGMTYGFLKTVFDLRKRVSPRIVFCWDHGIPVVGAKRPTNWREEYVAKYKVHRAQKKDDGTREIVFRQLGDVHRILSILGYSHFSVLGLEADDVIGILASALRDEMYVFSTDQDFYQLLDEARVRVLVPKKDKGDFRKIFQSDVEREFGFGVDRWAEYLALGGDKSDGIKPRPGMGPKTAIKLIKSGVDLGKPFKRQPVDFQKKYGEAWEDILNCHRCAQIPTSAKDARVAKLIEKNLFSNLKLEEPSFTLEEKALIRRKYENFCAERDMTTLLALRHNLFDTITISEEKPKCPRTETRKSKKTLFHLSPKGTSE